MHTIWNDLFVLAIPILEKIIRPILVYAFLIIGLRLAGKRELAQLNPFDLVVLLTLSNTVQNAIIGEDNTVLGGIIGATTLLLVNYLVVRFIHRNQKIEKMVEGEEVRLVDHGVMQTKLMAQEDVDVTELEIAAHKQGLEGLDSIETAILEPDGAISFIEKEITPAEQRQQELLDRIASLEAKLDLISAKI
jgi:uncharacterized membrane protein YcaP (DUF421 family)